MLFLAVFIIGLIVPVLSSTLGIATGNKTVDGRPLLFKTRDRTDAYPADVAYYAGGSGEYSFVFHKNYNQDHTQVRQAINTEGLGIGIANSENLTANGNGPNAAELLSITMKTCATIQDFRDLLNSTNGTRSQPAHIAIIDALGAGSMFEISGDSWVETPVVDDVYSLANTAVVHPDAGPPVSGSTSADRTARAMYLMNNGPAQGLDYKYFVKDVMQDFCHDQADEDAMPVGQYETNAVLSRYKTASGCVIKSCIPGDDPLIEGVMWLALSEPSLSIAIPFFANVEQIEDFILHTAPNDGFPGSFDDARRTVYNYENNRYGDRTADTYRLVEIRTMTFPIEDSLFTAYDENLGLWRIMTPSEARQPMTDWTRDMQLWAKVEYDAQINGVVKYILDVETTGDGSVTLNPTSTDNVYNDGTIVTLTAVDGGDQFEMWQGDLTGSANPETITMNSHKIVTAVFGQSIQYTLTVNTSGNGSVSLNPPGGVYTEGTVVTMTATEDPGWEFDSWSGDLTSSANPETITMDSDKNITATFTPVPQYTLTVNTSGNGSVSLNPPGGVYNEGTIVTLTATEDPGWEFDSWSGDLTSSANPETITMDSNKNVTAVFIQVPQYTLTVNTSGNGSVSLDPSGGVYNEGTVVTLTATEDPGWTFDSWSGDLTGSTNPETITMDTDKNVTATFVEMGLPYATLPYNTGFESGSLDQYWTIQTSDPEGRIRVSSAFSPYSGDFHMLMDVRVKNVYSTNEAWLHLDLSGETQVDLTFWWMEFSDEDHTEDGVFFSDNGGASFVKVYSLTGGVGYSQINLDVDQLASANGLSLSSTFIVKYQQRDNDKLKKDGFAFDDISVTIGLEKSFVFEIAELPTEHVLHQAFPNPFNLETCITFDLPKTEIVQLSIYNIRGQLVRILVSEKMLETGRYLYRWDGLDNQGNIIPSGLYIIRMNTKNFQAVQKIILLK
jgi:hypothetical protein